MGINFHSSKNRITYTTRKADVSWVGVIKKLVPLKDISTALDIGCGGGIYSKALADIGVPSVTGIDFSEVILEGAQENCKEYPQISFKQGDAYNTGLSSNSYDLVIERALIHHLTDLQQCFKEVHRVLKDEGVFLVQDRTPEDCLLEGNNTHIRGYMFELFPKLIEKEISRRHDSLKVINTLKEIGFREIKEIQLWETRTVYKNKQQLLKDLSERTGRSILHELNDKELEALINHVDKSISANNDIIEKDRWTIWKAVK